MAQMIIIVAERSSLAGAYRSGDVVVVVDDDHEFSPIEREMPIWRIVSIPGLPAAALEPFVLRGYRDGARRSLVIDMDSAAGRLLRASTAVVQMPPRVAFEFLSAARERTASE